MGIARASLEELLQDYEDLLRQRGLWLWPKDDPAVACPCCLQMFEDSVKTTGVELEVRDITGLLAETILPIAG